MSEKQHESESSGVELGKLVKHIRVSEIPRELPAKEKFVGLESIAAHAGQFLQLSSISEVRSRVFHFRNGDVLYGRLRPYLRKAAVADFEGFASGEILVLRCAEEILPNYLLTILLSDDFAQYTKLHTKGDRPRISFASISSYRIEIPSLEAQEEISERDVRLGASVAKLESATAEANRVTELILDRTRAKLIWESSGVGMVPLSDLIESIDYGTSQKSIYGGAGISILRIPNISSSGTIDATDLKSSVLSKRELDRTRLKEQDILLVRSNGSLALVGQAAKVGREFEGYSFAGYLLRIRPRAGVLSDYLLQIVRSNSFKRMVAAASRSSTGINNLSAGRLAKFVVPIVEPSRQQQVVDILSCLQASVNSSAAELKRSCTFAKELHESARSGWLGHTTFKGARSSAEKDLNTTSRSQRQAEGPEMPGDIQSMILEAIDATPNGNVSFSAIFDGRQIHYDAIRDVVFNLLAANPPVLTQDFDRDSRSIVLRRSK